MSGRKQSRMAREDAAFVCVHVLARERPVLLVAREAGDWMFLCGDRHGGAEDFAVVHRPHLYEDDPSLRDAVIGLEEGMEASRKDPRAPWTKGLVHGG